MKNLLQIIISILLLLTSTAGHATDSEALLMSRSSKSFEATLEQLAAAIAYNDYKISRIQRVDIGLTKSGYKTEKYRLVFFGKSSEINELASKHPNLIAYLPLKIVIFAEGNETIMLAMNPYQLRKLVPEKSLFTKYRKWEKDLRNILQAAKE